MTAMSFARSATLSFLRIRVIAGLASGLGALSAGVLCLSALFLRSHALGKAAIIALAVSLLGLAVIEGWRSWILFESGNWRTLGGRLTSRSEQPAWFVTWVSVYGLLGVTYSAAAAFMIWSAVVSGY
jgi:hypothetical protein